MFYFLWVPLFAYVFWINRGKRKYKKKIKSEYLNDDQDTSSEAKS